MGATGAGVPMCDAASPYLVVASGVLACKPRYVDNGDGTVTDNQSGLMWEQKVGVSDITVPCHAETTQVHDVDGCYTWSAATANNDPNGTLYTIFLATLNQVSTDDQNSTRFASHCDWRIPTLSELISIRSVAPPCDRPAPGSICIDPTFGPAAPERYWTSTTFTRLPAEAWSVDFNGGSPFPLGAVVGHKSVDNANFNASLQARAVRSVR